MQIDITGHHVDVTPALRAYVTEKMQKLIRHSDQVISIRVILKVEKLQQLAEAIRQCWRPQPYLHRHRTGYVCFNRRTG